MKINVAIAAGGDSSEYQISLNSAREVFKHLDRKKYNPFLVLIRGKEWMLRMDETEGVRIDMNDFSCRVGGKKVKFDVVFNAIHGTPGENGTLQSYFDIIGIPYTGSGSVTSTLTFNKYICKLFLEKYGIPTARSILIQSDENWMERVTTGEISCPCFVKPNNSGSSFGVSRVLKAEDLPSAISRALQEDDEIILEEFIDGTEVTCGLLKTAGNEYIFPLTEIVSKNEFFDFDAKYDPAKADEITPARISETATKEIQNLSSRIYSLLRCRGVVRIDYILSREKPYFLEINTIPGLSAESILPKQVKFYGLTLGNLFSLLIEDALSR
jgi:D-alanine-D-alanine ligase